MINRVITSSLVLAASTVVGIRIDISHIHKQIENLRADAKEVEKDVKEVHGRIDRMLERKS